MRKSSATVVFLPLCSRDAKEERETAMSVEERRRWRVRESTQERERERQREEGARALLPCALVLPGSTPGRDARSPPAPALRGCQISNYTFIQSHRYKLMINIPIHGFIMNLLLKIFIKNRIIIFYFIISHFHP
jgi:hypothetical protein